MFDQPYQLPERRVDVTLPPELLESFVGRYVLDDRYIDIVRRDGHLWLHSDGWPVGKYLVPVAEGEFEVPADMARA